MKKAMTILTALALILSLAACGAGKSAAADNASNTSMSYLESFDAQAEDIATETGSSISKTFSSVDSAVFDDPDAKVIRSAEISLQTLEFDQTVADLAALTEMYGGYYETAQIDSGGFYYQNSTRSAYYVIRIPKENYTAFRDNVGNVGYLRFFTEDAKNVGEEYYDTETRLNTLQTKYERLLALLEKAEVMEDIISLENAIADVQYEIDIHTSTLRKYDSLIDYSTFTINVDEVFEIKDEPGPQEGFGTRLWASLKDGVSSFGDSLQSFTLWFARNLISLIIIAAIAIIVVRIVLTVRKKRRTPPES